MKNSGNFQYFEHKNFNILLKKGWEIKAQSCLLSLKIMTIFIKLNGFLWRWLIICTESRQLWVLISHPFFNIILKFLCSKYWKFPEFFKNGPTFYSSSTQWPSLTIFHKSQFFFGTPCIVNLFYVLLCMGDKLPSEHNCWLYKHFVKKNKLR